MSESRDVNPDGERIRSRPSPPGVASSQLIPALAGLWVLAISQPVLDLIARQPQFLVAHGLNPWEVVLLGILMVAVPTLLAASALAARLGPWAAGGTVAVPTLLILLYLGGRLGLGGLSLLAGGVGVAALAAVLYVRRLPLQEMARYLVLVPPVVTLYFFLVLPRAVLAGEEAGSSAPITKVDNPVPVVVVVLDELPLASLIDADGDLLEGSFPSFARLAADGVWYRNAITVETRTTESIPAILSGRLIPDGLVPNFADHPRTLMTMLSSSHHVEALEPVTELCPEWVCGRGDERGRKWSILASDLGVVYGHLVVPAPWADRLPSIDENWRGFVAGEEGSWDLTEAVGEAVEGDRRADVARFIESLEPGHDRPPLRVAHLVLPHRPWDYLPDGSRHGQSSPEGYGRRGWGEDGFFVAEGWRRHLLQVAYTDTVLGEMIQRLEEEGMYQSSLVVVVADHGVHFAPGVEDMRVTDRNSLGSILPVPLFVKYPAGFAAAPLPGTIDDRRAETTDVAPTVLDVVGADPGDLDGRSLLSSSTRAGSVLELRGEPFPVDATGDEKRQVAREKEAWFPEGDVWSLVPDPSFRPLLGRAVPSEDDHPVQLELQGVPLPPLIEGTVRWGKDTGQYAALALVDGDGTVVAITKPYGIGERTGEFSFLVDPDGAGRAPFSVHALGVEAGSIR